MTESNTVPLRCKDMTPEERAMLGSRAQAVVLMVLGIASAVGLSAGMFWLMGATM